MFEPLIKVLLQKLDVAAEAYLERQQMINLLAVPGTVLFLLLFWAFTGAGGFMLLLGLFLTALEVGIAVGLFLLKDKYTDQLQEWVCAADAIEAHLTGGDVFDEWTDFLQNPAGDPELEQIRAMCQVLPDQYPPTEVGAYCGPEGIAMMHESIDRLRIGIVSKGYEDFRTWWAARQEAKHLPGDGGLGKKQKKKKKRKKKGDEDTPPDGIRKFGRATAAEADAVMRVAKMSGGILDASEQERIDSEAARESARAAKEAKREAKRASRTARKATKQARKQEKKLRRRAAMMESVEDEMVLYQDQEEEDLPRARRAAAAPMQPPPQRYVEADEEEDEEEDYGYEPEERAHNVPLRAAPPPPPVPTRRRQRGLTEAAAIEQVMQGGLTAHHYDDAQHRLAERLGRDPKPSEVVKALKAQFSKKSRKRAAKQEKREKRGRGKRVQKPLAAFRIDAGNQDLRHHRPIRPAGPIRTFARVVFVLGLIGSLPFAAWRIPQPEAKPIVLEGEVRHELLDHAPDIQHQLRTPFEEMLGYKPVTLLDGERIYVNEKDYGLCWPESWDEIYENRYTVRITAEVTKLLFGGYSVATITSAERVDLPVATGTDDYIIEPPAPPRQWQPTRRIHRPGLGR